MKSNIIDVIYDNLKHETERAYLVSIAGKDIWLPKSKVEICEKDCSVAMEEWLAIEKELV